MRTIRRAAVVALLAIGFTVVAPSPAGAADASAEHAFIEQINSLRASKGLNLLRIDGELTGAARSWTDQMIEDDRLSHNPNLASVSSADWTKLGENVGRGGNVDQLMQAFIASPVHYRNLVDPAFDFIGVGVSYDADGRMYTTHDFMAVAGGSESPTPAPANAPAPDPRPEPAPSLPPRSPAEPQRVRTVLLVLLEAVP